MVSLRVWDITVAGQHCQLMTVAVLLRKHPDFKPYT